MIVVVGLALPVACFRIDGAEWTKWVCNFMMTADFSDSGNWVWVWGLVCIDDASGLAVFLCTGISMINKEFLRLRNKRTLCGEMA
jgi:hypothetical protein